MKIAALYLVWCLGPVALIFAWIILVPEEWAHALGRHVLAPIINVSGIGLWILGAFRLIEYWGRKRASRDCAHLQAVTRCHYCGCVLLGEFKARGTLST